MSVRQFVKSHPLLFVIIVAAVLRVPAVVFSKGYMASDDHYETILVAYNWLTHGFFADDGHLLWRHLTDRDISRFPLYTFSLNGIMQVSHWFGVESLNTMMYGIRLIHALLSLITVWMVYRIVAMVTRSANWAIVAGLVAGAHGLMPYLSVRNLVEMVGAHFLVATFYFIYRYRHRMEGKWLFWAGIVTGLAWMIRFPVILAVLPIPFLLWWESGRVGPALRYCAAGALMVLLSGVFDYFVLGSFMASTVNLVADFLSGGEAMYGTNVMIYPAVLLAFFIPPFSLVAFPLVFSKAVWRNHKLLVIPILSFVIMHSCLANRQERFMIPVIPLLMALLMIALWHHYDAGGFLFRKKKLLCSIVGLSLVINLLLLGTFTVNYSHRGLVEPFVRVEKLDPRPRVVLVSPERFQIYPFYYGGYDYIRHFIVNDWSDLDSFVPDAARPNFFFLYPASPEDLPSYVDSITRRFGGLTEVFHVAPSVVDLALHRLNPGYNPTHEAWAYRLERESPL